MDRREALSAELKQFVKTLYYQPPSNISMSYDCIVYTKMQPKQEKANNYNYIHQQKWQLTLIERTVDTGIAEKIRDHFMKCSIINYFAKDNLYHTIIELYY